MAKVWPTLTANQKQYLAELSAGKRQVTVLNSLLTNWESVDEAVKNAANSADSATEENEKYMDSIAGRTTALQSAIERFSTASVDDSLIKWFISAETSVVNFGSSIGGMMPILLSLITLLSSKLVPTIIKVANTVKTSITAMSLAGSAATGWFAIISAGLAVITAITGAINSHNEAVKQERQEHIDTARSIADSSQELSQLYAAYSELEKIENKTQAQEEKLISTSSDLESALGDRASVLKTLTDGTASYNEELRKVLQTQA